MDKPSPNKHYSYESEELVKRVAWMYYEEDLNQQEIAHALGLSRTKVLRLLKESRESGLVKVSLDIQAGLVFPLEKKICNLTGMRECFVVPGRHDPLVSVAKGLAYRFAQALQSCQAIGFGGGRTLHAFAKELAPSSGKTTVKYLVSLAGNTKANLAVEPYDIAYTLVGKLPVEYFHIWAPARVADPREAKLIKEMPSIKAVLQKAESIDLAFVGIGDMHNSSFVRYGYLSPKELEAIQEAGAVGEILGRFYDINGRVLEKDLNENFVGVTMPMKNTVVGVAGGMDKLNAILGGVRTGWLNGLIIDEQTASALIAAMQKQSRTGGI